jgi:ribokinase
MTQAPDVVVVGSANLDLVARVSRLPRPGETVSGRDYAEVPGGKGANQAVAAARAGAHVAFVGAVGDDHAGALLRDTLAAEGIDVSGLRRVELPTGRALIGVSDMAENSIIVVPGANSLVDEGVVESACDLLQGCRVVLCQLEIPLAGIARAFELAVGARRVLNPAPAPELALPQELLVLVDLLVPNEHEIALLGGVESVAGSVGSIVVTEGAQGAAYYTPEGPRRVEPYVVTPVDTTAAGDAFCGTLAARLALGDPIDRALAAGAAAGALATTRPGAIPSLPCWDEIERVVSAGT